MNADGMKMAVQRILFKTMNSRRETLWSEFQYKDAVAYGRTGDVYMHQTIRLIYMSFTSTLIAALKL